MNQQQNAISLDRVNNTSFKHTPFENQELKMTSVTPKPFLFLWNPKMDTESFSDYELIVRNAQNGITYKTDWICPSTRPKPGDIAIMQRTGPKNNGIFARGIVTASPYIRETDNIRVLEIELDQFLAIGSEIPRQKIVSESGYTKNWQPMASGNIIPVELFEAIDSFFRNTHNTSPQSIGSSSKAQIEFNDEEKSILLFFMNKYDRTLTATDIANQFGFANAGAVNLKIWKMAEKVAPIIGYSPIQESDGTKKWWPALFHGKFREDGKFEWHLKPEIEDLIIKNHAISTIRNSVFEVDQVFISIPSPKDPVAYEVPASIISPKCIEKPRRTYERNPEIKRYLASIVGPYCECCGWKSDIINSSGDIYIEAHHLLPIANGGSDSVSNTLLLCPNCHRKFHYSFHSTELIENVLQKIPRLIDERQKTALQANANITE